MIDMRRKFDDRRIHKKFFERRRVGMKAPRTFGVQNPGLKERNEFFGHARFVHPMDVVQWGLKKRSRADGWVLCRLTLPENNRPKRVSAAGGVCRSGRQMRL